MLKINKMPNLAKWRKEISDTPIKLSTLANQVIVEIRMNTQGGRDKNGNSFRPYSASYAKEKAKTHGTKVNLTRTGRMLNSMTSETIDKGVRIFFAVGTENDKAYHNSEVYGRQFFGITRQRFASYYLPKLKKLYKF